jgi:hypothetical protein
MKKLLTILLTAIFIEWSLVPVYAYTEGTNFERAGLGIYGVRMAEMAEEIDDAITSASNTAELTDNYIFVGDASNDPVGVDVTGDIDIDSDGVTSITAGAIVNADVNASAAIAFSKLAASTDINTSGQVVDFTITGEAQGEVLYFDGSGWESLNVGTSGYALLSAGAGANPYWGIPPVSQATTAAQSLTIEAGTNDVTLLTTTQTVGAVNLTIPDFANQDSTMAVLELAQTFTAAQTFPNTGLHLLDTNASHDLIVIPGSNLTADRNFTITTGDAARTLTMGGNITTTGDLITVGDDSLTFTTGGATDVTLPTTGTLATIAGTENLTGKTLTTPKIDDGDADVTITSADQTNAAATITIPDCADAADTFVLVDTTQTLTAKTLTSPTLTTALIDDSDTGISITSADQTHAAPTATIPDIGDAADSFVMNDTAATLTNKTIDADGTGNVISNINGNELDPITVGASTYGVPIIITKTITNAATVVVFDNNAPFKFLILDAWTRNDSADGGTWKLHSDAAGAGTDINSAVTVEASDTDIDRLANLDDSVATVAENGDLAVITDGGLDATIFIEIIRID